MSHLDRVDVDAVELEYELRGAGDAVVLVHAGVCADFFEPLREEPALADRHRLLRYHRVGYAGSGSVDGSVSIADQAAHCGVLMRHLGVGRAHVVGHSSSAMIVLQREDASRAVQPALVVLGERSNPVFGERSELLLSWLPAAERFTLPGATHLLQVENPSAMAEGLAAFLARHPVSG